jgi:hypothetical protein
VAVNAVVLKVLGKELVETEDFGVGPHVSVVPRELMIPLVREVRSREDLCLGTRSSTE